ncbi:hypothetical protein FOZ63_021427, partial [Perkinsus olseni]
VAVLGVVIAVAVLGVVVAVAVLGVVIAVAVLGVVIAVAVLGVVVAVAVLGVVIAVAVLGVVIAEAVLAVVVEVAVFGVVVEVVLVIAIPTVPAVALLEKYLADLPGEAVVFDAVDQYFGSEPLAFSVHDVDKMGFKRSLKLKRGSKIMATVNDRDGRFVNGSFGL